MGTYQLFYDLFEGRLNAYGGDEGRAIYLPGQFASRELWISRHIPRHFSGEQPIGVYPIRFENNDLWHEMSELERMDNMVVKWGCCDIDTGDWTEAYNLARALELMNLNPWIERSRSKGWHIWIFSDQWVPAWVMRRCLKVAYKAIGLPAKEANPKSELLQPNQLGNYVRLPYNGAANPGRQVMMVGWVQQGDGFPLTLPEFLGRTDLLSEAATIRSWASKWYEPPRVKIVVDAVTDANTEALVNGLPKGLRTLYDNGPKPIPMEHGQPPKQDTSQGLVALAVNMAKIGYSPSDVMLVVSAADRRWGKYSERNNPEIYYEGIVRYAYREH